MFQKCEELFKKYTYMILHTHFTRSLKQSKGRKKDKMEKERERESMRDKKCKRARKEFIFTYAIINLSLTSCHSSFKSA